MNEVEDLEISKKLGIYFKNIRKSKKITQIDLAKDLGIVQSTVHKFETGNMKFTFSLFIQLVNYYDLNINDVFSSFSNYFNDELDIEKRIYRSEYQIANDISTLISYIVSNKFNHDELVHLNNYAKFIVNERDNT